MVIRIQLRGGTAAAWTAANPTLAARELGLETDTIKLKLGDGSTAWNSLAYFNAGSVFAATLTANSILYAVTSGTPAALALAANQFAARASTGNIAAKTITDAALALLDDADAAAMRTTLGLGAAALLADPIPVANGGTGSATAAAALAALGAQAGSSGAALPTGGSIVTGQIFRLTAQDATAKAGQGLYMHDGTGWLCLRCAVPYVWGNMGATPALALIAGCDYVFTADQAWTAVVTMSRPGVCNWTKTGAFTANAPTATGRTVKTRTSDGWTDAGAAIVEGCFRDDGTYMFISAVEGA